MSAFRGDAELVRARYAALIEVGPSKPAALYALLLGRGLAEGWCDGNSCSAWLFSLKMAGYARRDERGLYEAALTLREFDTTRQYRYDKRMRQARAGLSTATKLKVERAAAKKSPLPPRKKSLLPPARMAVPPILRGLV